MEQQKDDSLERRCAEAVSQLIARYQWRLLARGEFVKLTAAQLGLGLAIDPHRAAIFVYSQAMYQACSGAEGLERQNLGYQELHPYLHAIARRRYADVADEATQIALVQIFSKFETCRRPGTFLAFALQHLMDAARMARRQNNVATPHDVGEKAFDDLSINRQADLAAEVINTELHERFERVAAEFLQHHPRSSRQIMALRLKYIDGLDEVEISQKLGVTVAGVYILRSRAIAKLRVDPNWRELASEFGISSDTSAQSK